MGVDQILEEQIRYYRARATEYDSWFLRQGRFDFGNEWNRQWFSDVEELRRQLKRFQPAGKVLEFAGGTGWWTEELARYADHVTTVDSSPEVLEINRQRNSAPHVRHLEADLFEWTPDGLYDVVFFSFWLSHVPPERLDWFWGLVKACLREDGRVLFFDSLWYETPKTLPGRRRTTTEDFLTTRRLGDGSEFKIVKLFYEPDALEARLRELGWSVDAARTENFFLHGSGRPTLP